MSHQGFALSLLAVVAVEKLSDRASESFLPERRGLSMKSGCVHDYIVFFVYNPHFQKNGRKFAQDPPRQ
jgi:hypothetical protein